MKKKKKGEYGYRNSFKQWQLLKISILVAFILAQLGARYFTTSQTVKNILTVMAVVTVLPAANLASPLVAILKYHTSSKEFYNQISPYEKKFVILYDLVITTKEYVLPMDAVIVHPTGVYAYCINPKTNIPNAEKAVNEMFSEQRLDPNVKITKDFFAFEKRIKSLKPSSEYDDDGSVEFAAKLLRSLSM
ncbi:MAG: O-linked GlcNAc transferase-like protein [Clostridium sp.]